MIKLQNYKINKQLDSNQTYLNLKKFIDNYTNNPINLDFIKKISNEFNIPEKVVIHKFKRLVYNEYVPEICKFKFYSKLKLFINFIIFISTILIVRIFGKKDFKLKRYDLILDEVDNVRQFEKFKNLLKKFDSAIIFTSNYNVVKEVRKNNFHTIKYNQIMPSKKILLGRFFNILKFFFKLYKKSIKENEIYITFYQKILLSILKNETLFSKATAKVILQDRFYINCPIKNFIFKKYGGKQIICCQYHLAESSLCLYSDIDLLFTFGKERNTKKKLEIFGSRIDNIMPVGSIEMEKEFYGHEENDESSKIDDFDLLIIGVNTPQWINSSDKIYKSYYIYLNWIAKFAKNNPDLNIVYKHHTSFREDKIENKIFHNVRIKILREGNSYQYLKKCKVAISYGSTMILEALSLKKNCFFVEPEKGASTFYSYHNYDKNLFLNNYDNFSGKIIENLNHSSKSKIDYDKICLNSKNVINSIYENIKKIND